MNNKKTIKTEIKIGHAELEAIIINAMREDIDENNLGCSKVELRLERKDVSDPRDGHGYAEYEYSATLIHHADIK